MGSVVEASVIYLITGRRDLMLNYVNRVEGVTRMLAVGLDLDEGTFLNAGQYGLGSRMSQSTE